MIRGAQSEQLVEISLSTTWLCWAVSDTLQGWGMLASATWHSDGAPHVEHVGGVSPMSMSLSHGVGTVPGRSISSDQRLRANAPYHLEVIPVSALLAFRTILYYLKWLASTASWIRFIVE